MKDKETRFLTSEVVRHLKQYGITFESEVVSLDEVYDLLPKKIAIDNTVYHLIVNDVSEYIVYEDLTRGKDGVLVGVSFREIPFISAVYSMLCWYCEQSGMFQSSSLKEDTDN